MDSEVSVDGSALIAEENSYVGGGPFWVFAFTVET